MAETTLSGKMKSQRVALTGVAQSLALDADCCAIDIRVSGNSLLFSGNTAPDADNSFPYADGDTDNIQSDALKNSTIYFLSPTNAGYLYIRQWIGLQT